ncbi:hypothetical protein B0T21DRAFT_254298, partial [Apiosordaria backusii]
YLCQCSVPAHTSRCKAKSFCPFGDQLANRCKKCQSRLQQSLKCGPVMLSDKYTVSAVPSNSFVPLPGGKEEKFPRDITPPQRNLHRAYGTDNIYP